MPRCGWKGLVYFTKKDSRWVQLPVLGLAIQCFSLSQMVGVGWCNVYGARQITFLAHSSGNRGRNLNWISVQTWSKSCKLQTLLRLKRWIGPVFQVKAETCSGERELHKNRLEFGTSPLSFKLSCGLGNSYSVDVMNLKVGKACS